MEFLDKLGKKASEAYKVTADKTGKIAREAKLRMKISDLKSKVNDMYKQIGKTIYERHVRGEGIDIETDLKEECAKIDSLCEEIENNLKECLDLRNKKQCQKCYKEIEKDMNYCPECGTKQEDETKEEKQAKEVEILDRLEKVDFETETNNEEIEEEPTEPEPEIIEEPEKEEEPQQEPEKLTEEEEQKSKDELQNTVEIESDVKKEENN